jgi:hypothetical protein
VKEFTEVPGLPQELSDRVAGQPGKGDSHPVIVHATVDDAVSR